MALSAVPALAASPGCDAVNAGGLNQAPNFFPLSMTVNGAFAAGEQITLLVTPGGNASVFGPVGLTLTLGAQISDIQAVPGTPVGLDGYTVTLTANGTEVSATLSQENVTADLPQPIIVTCAPPGAAVLAPSKKLALMQQKAKLSAQASGSAFSGAIGAAVSDAFAAGCDAVTPLSDGIRITVSGWRDRDPACYDDNRRQGTRGDTPDISLRRDARNRPALLSSTQRKPPPGASRDWQVWLELRGTDYNASQGNDSLRGLQFNALIGLTYHVSSDIIVGIYGGYENFRFTSDAIDGRLAGNGGTIGNYLGWRIGKGLRFDAGYGYTRVGYEVSATDAGLFMSGRFQGDRWMFTTGLTGDYVWRAFTLEPSLRLYWLNERDKAYVDSTGTTQAALSFSTGRASAGNKLIFPTQKLASIAYAPYVGLYGDYYFTADGSIAALTQTGATVLTLKGWSARATGGITIKLRNGAELMGGGEYGGIGGPIRMWTYRLRASVPF